MLYPLMDDEPTWCSSSPHGLFLPAHPRQGHRTCLLLLGEGDMQSCIGNTTPIAQEHEGMSV